MNATLEQLYRTFASEFLEHCAAIEAAVLASERGEADQALVRAALRAAHTLKGDAQSLGFEPIGELVHVLEDRLLPLTSGAQIADSSQVLIAIDRLRGCVPALEAGQPPDTASVARCLSALRDGAANEDDMADAVAGVSVPRLKLSLELLDELINWVGELDAARRLLRARCRSLPGDARTGLLEALDRLDHPAEEIENIALRARMVPLAPMLESQVRVVRDAASRSGKRAKLSIEGGEIELDAALIERLRVSLVHVLRNAIDHGIEPPEARRLAGKPEVGLIKITVTRRGRRIAIEVLDDGGGLNLQRIEQRARELGWLGESETVDQEKLQGFVLRPGFSTATTTSDLSGRGVGLDAVSTFVHELGGSVELQSFSGFGLMLTLLLPVTLAIIDGLQARVGGASFVLPVDVVERCAPCEATADRRRWQIVDLDGDTLSCLQLGEILDMQPARGGRQTLVIARHSERRIGLLVDRVEKMGRVLIKPMTGGAESAPGVVGSALTEEGKVALVLDVRQLFEFAVHEQEPVA